MKSTLEYVSYFEALATKATFIDDFFYTYDEFKENSDQAEGVIFVLEPYDNPISENQNDNALASRSGFFVILKAYDSDLGREAANVQDACEKLCYKVIGQMKRDSRANLITIDIQNWEGEPAQPIVGNWMGYSIRFNFEAPINSFMAYDADDWDEGA
jgi:hypothetical protein